MPHDDEIDELRARLELAEAVRDTAVAELERARDRATTEAALLSAEQDRFVSHVIESHEREIGKFRGQVEEARAVADQATAKLTRARQRAVTLEEDLAGARCEIDALVKERDRLLAELDMARVFLGDAMETVRPSATMTSRAPATKSSRPEVEPRKSVVVGRANGPARRRPSAGGFGAVHPRVTPPPRRIAINEAPSGSEPPPSSR